MTKPPSICVVIGSLGRGGTEKHLVQILPALKAEGFAPYVITLRHRGPLAHQLEDNDIAVKGTWIASNIDHPGPILRVLLLFPMAASLFGHFLFKRPKIIHFFLPTSYLVGAPLALLAGHRRCIMSRRSLNNYQSNFPKLITLFEHFLHRRMIAVVGNSQHVVAQLASEEGVPTDRLFLIYNGVVPSAGHDKNQLRVRLGIAEQDVVIVNVANLIPYKGHAGLLEACSRLPTILRWQLLIIGDDSKGIRASLEAQAVRLGIADRVRFMGERPDARDLLTCADIGVLASDEEGFSNAILEGMAESLPMVVTDVGGNSEAVISAVTGFVVPARDPVAMADALTKLLNDRGLRTKMGRAGAERARSAFSVKCCIENYKNLYATILGDNR